MSEAEPEAPTSVLDASALLALIHIEDGAAVVEAALAGRSAISVVNWAEALSKVAERGGTQSLGDRIPRARFRRGCVVN